MCSNTPDLSFLYTFSPSFSHQNDIRSTSIWSSLSKRPFHLPSPSFATAGPQLHRLQLGMINLQKYHVITTHLARNATFWRRLHVGPDSVEEMLDRHLVKEKPVYDDDENELLTRQRLTSTRREALSLYRDIFRATRFFMWPDSRGVLWRDILRENARKEFEEARYEKDPEVITRLLIGGRDAVQSALDKLAEKQREQIEKERNNRT